MEKQKGQVERDGAGKMTQLLRIFTDLVEERIALPSIRRQGS